MDNTASLDDESIASTKLIKKEPDDLFELDYYSNPEDEAISYLRQMLKLAKRKVRSKKIENNGKVRWARAGVEASKILLYSGVIERSERRKITRERSQFTDVLQELFSKDTQELSTL